MRHSEPDHPTLRDQAVVLTGREIDWFAAKTIAIGLETWAKHRIKVNRAYTPKRMMQRAAQITGKSFRATDYLGAAKEIRRVVDREREEARVRQSVADSFGRAL